MPQEPFVDGLFVPDFGVGTGIALWALRACAFGRANCCVVNRGYERVFGAEGPETLSSIQRLAQALGQDGRRKLTVGTPGCARITHDEMSIAAMFAAAQAGDATVRDAHATWLFGGPAPRDTVEVVAAIARIFAGYELPMTMPEALAGPAPAPRRTERAPAFHALAGGTA